MDSPSIDVSFRELPASPYLQAQWSDLWRIPWGLIVALFYLFPKELIHHLRGEEEEGEPGYEEPLPGWHSYLTIEGNEVSREYFYAMEVFEDFYWHTVDGYRLRAEPSFPDLEDYYFARRSFQVFSHGLVAQAIQVGGERNNCPIVFIDFQRKSIQNLCELPLPALLKFEQTDPKHLMITGETEDLRFELRLSPLSP